jgi:alpha-L-fucosidase
MKDICGLWKKAADRHGLPFGLTEHLGATFSWWAVNKGADRYGPYAGVPYDGNDPAYRDYYLDNGEHFRRDSNDFPWYTPNAGYPAYWLSVMTEIIDLYTPDLIYTDGSLPFGSHWHSGPAFAVQGGDYRAGLEAVSYLYNKSAEKHGGNRAVYTQKDRREEIYSVGVLDIEKSQLSGIQNRPWQTDTCIGNWFYDAKQVFKKPAHIIEMLIDIVSKNGNMLLNILQRPDGSIDDETQYILRELASWVSVCGEGIYGSRPWRVSGEGYSSVLIEEFREEAVKWTDTDFRFTRKGKTVYAFLMRVPENRVAVIRGFTPEERVISVRLLGAEGAVPFSQNFGVLTVQLPERMPTAYANCLAVELA